MQRNHGNAARGGRVHCASIGRYQDSQNSAQAGKFSQGISNDEVNLRLVSQLLNLRTVGRTADQKGARDADPIDELFPMRDRPLTVGHRLKLVCRSVNEQSDLFSVLLKLIRIPLRTIWRNAWTEITSFVRQLHVHFHLMLVEENM